MASQNLTSASLPVRRKLPNDRQAITHRFSIADQIGYITVGMFEDGTPGEIFMTLPKEGSTVSGFVDCFAAAISFNLQHGVPLKFLADKFNHTPFEPSGWTNNQQIPYAKSVVDYVFQWLSAKFPAPPVPPDDQLPLPLEAVGADLPVFSMAPVVVECHACHYSPMACMTTGGANAHLRCTRCFSSQPLPE